MTPQFIHFERSQTFADLLTLLASPFLYETLRVTRWENTTLAPLQKIAVGFWMPKFGGNLELSP